ncbi:Membrane Protein Functionally coupled to the MukBEF Chromosome Partitioning Mechanism [Cronobacter sakazakii 701]|nr:Membrane Protein Functionally coupled to the MukBEF Chromosome Partitioning Mechanism [Cronobacter sakazakii 701]
MLFILKKLTGTLLLPLPFLLLMMGIALALLWFTRFKQSGKILMTASWVILLLFSLQPVADGLLKPVEDDYPTWNGQKADYIVVLGGGYTWNDKWAPSSNLVNNSLPRVTEGVRLWLANPGAKMVFWSAPPKQVPAWQKA